MHINIIKYKSSYKQLWNHFVNESKNGTFIVNRDYLEYHANRFEDHSLLFFQKNKLIAILPANLHNHKVLISHEGLTYGGLIMSSYTKTVHVLAIFEVLKKYLSSQGITELIYKKIPYIYCTHPSDEDVYALFKSHALHIGCASSSCIYLENKLPYSDLRRRCLKKSGRHNFEIKVSNNFTHFWNILESNLSQKYQTKPTHTLFEIQLLYNKFPDNIKLYHVSHRDSILGGCVAYITQQCFHIQYISSTTEGRSMGALDYLFDFLIHNQSPSTKFFDFGISTENNGLYLNQDLMFQKEGFGARVVTYDTYKIILKENQE